MSGDHEMKFEENVTRRSRLRKMETQQRIQMLRQALPEYTLKDIREHRLPYCEAMLLELEEEKLVHTREYIKQLFANEQQQKLEVEATNSVWSRPFLKDSPVELRLLKEALMSAEKAHNSGMFSREVEEMIRVAIHFSFNTDGEEWWWLGEELNIQSVDLAKEYKSDDGQLEAFARYIYAKFLIENAGEYVSAEHQLTLARELSSGKTWNMKQFFPGVKDTLSMNLSRMLYTCAIRQAKFWSKTNRLKAAALALKAKKRANEACYHDGETEALFVKGTCELEMNDYANAISDFNKAYYIQAKLQSPIGMCEARVQLSKAYLVHGAPQLALQNLIFLKQTAELNELPFYLAQAYRYLGEYYLNKGEAHKATPLLADALEIFYQQKSVDESEQVRNLQAISAGLELMPRYIQLLKQTDKNYANWFEDIIKLVQWKDSREPFWNIDEIIETETLDQALQTAEAELLRSISNAEKRANSFKLLQRVKAPEHHSAVSLRRSAYNSMPTVSDSRQPIELKAVTIIEEYVEKIEGKHKRKKKPNTSV